MREPAGRTRGGAVQRGVQRKEESGSLFGYILACLRDPRGLSAVGAGGLEGRRLLIQLAAAFAATTYVSGTVLLALTLGFGVKALAGGLVGVVSNFGSLLVLTVAFWFVAGLVKSKAGFTTLLTGLAFVHVMASLVLVLVALAAGLSMLFGSTAETAVVVLAIAYFVVVVAYTAFYAMGVFDAGCIGSFVLAIVAAVIADALQKTIVKGLGALFGG